MKILPHSLYTFLFLGSQLAHLRTGSIINSFSNCDFVFVRVYICAWASVCVCVCAEIYIALVGIYSVIRGPSYSLDLRHY